MADDNSKSSIHNNPEQHDNLRDVSASIGSNFVRLTKKMSSTASVLASSSIYGDQVPSLSDLAPGIKQPSMQKHLIAATRHYPQEILKGNLSRKELLFQTYIPDELLLDIPEASGGNHGFTLFQGYEASNLLSKSDIKTLKSRASSNEGSLNINETMQEKNKLSRTLDLLEIRKQLASSEIKEIDDKIRRLNQMREIVFKRVAEIENEEFTVEKEVQQLEDRIENMEATDRLKARLSPGSAQSTLTDEILQKSSGPAELTESPCVSPNSNKVSNRRKSLRKTRPILQQYYEPGQNINVIPAHSDCVTCLDFDIPFGTMLSASSDDTLKVWDLRNCKLMAELEGHKASVLCLQVEGSIAATGSADASIRLWDLAAISEDTSLTTETDYNAASRGNECLEVMEAHMDKVTALSMSDTTLVSGSSDKTIRHWDLETGRCLQTLDVLFAASQADPLNNINSNHSWNLNDPSAVFVGALQCYDAALASGTVDGIVRLWDLRSGQVTRSLLGHTAAISALQFDQTHLVTASHDRSVRVWDLRMGSICEAYAYQHPITSMCFDVRRICCAAGENVVKVYDRTLDKHWSCGAGVDDNEAAIVNTVECHEGYMVEGRQDGAIGIWAC